ncbi:hypothetical protein Q7P37_010167 [Cladosporium fusiforme]
MDIQDQEKKAGIANDDSGNSQPESLQEGEQKFNKLGWKRLTICLIVEAIALGSLSLPAVFATLGMIPGLLITVFIGILAMYTSYIIGQVKLKFPHIKDYAEAMGLIWGPWGKNLAVVMFITMLLLLIGSHVLTGTIALIKITDELSMCALVWGVISAILLFLLALPPTFADFAILGYVDFASILLAIGITIIATGIEASNAPGGLGAVQWRLWPAPGTPFSSAFLAVANILFAYTFGMVQFSFMDEMHTPSDYIKSTCAIGVIEIVIYTLTGSLIYAFVGDDVASPALLSTSKTVSRIAFGVALPVIFISGSINSTVLGKYFMGRAFKDSKIRLINDKRGWAVWLAVLAVITVLSWIIGEAIPFFSSLLGVIASLFISGFTIYFPALFWFMLLKEGKWNSSWQNICLCILNALVVVVGLVFLGCGTYASIQSIVDAYAEGAVGSAFACASSQYV